MKEPTVNLVGLAIAEQALLRMDLQDSDLWVRLTGKIDKAPGAKTLYRPKK